MRKVVLSCLIMALAAGVAATGAVIASEAASAPQGSYRKTCRDIKADANGIYAVCQRKNGSWKKTSLSSSVFPCREVENDDGDLVCVNW